MKKTAGACVGMLVTLAMHAAQAHHAWPVDRDELITVQGTVTDFVWANPHPMITLDVASADGGSETWQVGGPAINRMEARGWTKDTVKAGDTITGVGYQFRDGQKIIRLEKVTFADGTEFQVYER
ncbi:MAG: hypothetical protein RLZZ227_1483 [Pseudomonadota bacterium]|jgi:hypothetical protein